MNAFRTLTAAITFASLGVAAPAAMAQVAGGTDASTDLTTGVNASTSTNTGTGTLGAGVSSGPTTTTDRYDGPEANTEAPTGIGTPGSSTGMGPTDQGGDSQSSPSVTGPDVGNTTELSEELDRGDYDD